MKKILIYLVLVILVISLSSIGIGCKDESAVKEEVEVEEVTNEEVEEVTDEEVEEVAITEEDITIYMTGIATQSTGKWKNWFENYAIDHPNVSMKLSTYDLGDLGPLVESGLASGGEDLDLVWYIAGSFVNTWARAGLLRNLNDLFEKYGWEDKKIGVTQKYQTDDLGYFHIADAGVLVPMIYYNMDILDEVGVDLPTTVEGFFEIAPAIQEAGYTVLLNGAGQIRFFRMFNWVLQRGMGTEKYEELLFWGEDPDRSIETAEIFRSQEVVDAYTTMKRMLDEEIYPEGAMGMDGTANLASFVNGDAAFYDNGNWAVNFILDGFEESGNSFNFGAMGLPPLNEGDTDLPYLANFANGVCIPAYVSEEKVAIIADVINESINNKEYAKDTFITEGVFSTNNDFTSEELDELLHPVSKDIYEDFQEKGATLIIDHWQEAGFRSAYEEIINIVMLGDMTPEEGAQALYDAAVKSLD